MNHLAGNTKNQYFWGVKSRVLKILFILPRFPWPLEKGDKLRAFHFIRLLSENHEVHLFALSDRLVKKDDYAAILPYCQSLEVAYCSKWRIFRGLIWAGVRRLPFQVGYFYHREARGRIASLANRISPDLVFCQLVRVAHYADRLPGVKMIDFQDALSLNLARRAHASRGLKRLFFMWESNLLQRYEVRVLRMFDLHLIISQPDKDAIAHADRERILVVPNGVDYDYFSADQDAVKSYDIVFTGNMSYAPNVEGAVWLAKEILPLVREHIPGATLLLAGSSPVKAVKELESDGIRVTGWMPDIRNAYNSSKVFVAPMLTGSGLQNKLLEAMAMELPCITTSLANDALQARDRDEIIVADSAGDIASAIAALLTDEGLAKNIATAGNKMVRRKYCWRAVLSRLNVETIQKL
ncbi:MAG: glycosyltransferase [Bacteroidales bacterium]